MPFSGHLEGSCRTAAALPAQLAVFSDQWWKEGGGRESDNGMEPPLGGLKGPSWPKEPRPGEGVTRQRGLELLEGSSG